MRNMAVMMLMAVLSSGAIAEWVAIGKNDMVVTYVDQSTRRQNGNLVKMWTLQDLARPKKVGKDKPYLSSMTQFEFDCKEEQTRLLAITAYSGNMAKGEVIKNITSTSQWSPIVPGSANQFQWEKACLN